MSAPPTEAVYGAPPLELAEASPTAVQTSPLRPGSTAIEALDSAALDRFVLLAPPGTVERRYALAQALRALRPGGELVAMAPKAKGGARLGDELAAFGYEVGESGKRHHRICVVRRPQDVSGVEAAIAGGAPRIVEPLGWTQPGVFSWDRLDPGSRLLMDSLPALSGAGADLGAGLGVLSRAALAAPTVADLTLVDIDRRAIECARRNVQDPRARFAWADVRGPESPSDLDFVVMNPPFHDGGAEDRALGAAFIAAAAAMLRKGGGCWLVANRHLPYEQVLAERFANVRLRAESGGFKVYEAVR